MERHTRNEFDLWVIRLSLPLSLFAVSYLLTVHSLYSPFSLFLSSTGLPSPLRLSRLPSYKKSNAIQLMAWIIIVIGPIENMRWAESVRRYGGSDGALLVNIVNTFAEWRKTEKRRKKMQMHVFLHKEAIFWEETFKRFNWCDLLEFWFSYDFINKKSLGTAHDTRTLRFATFRLSSKWPKVAQLMQSPLHKIFFV